jgi:hypothetical protein
MDGEGTPRLDFRKAIEGFRSINQVLVLKLFLISKQQLDEPPISRDRIAWAISEGEDWLVCTLHADAGCILYSGHQRWFRDLSLINQTSPKFLKPE